MYIHIHIYTYTHIYIYIYIYMLQYYMTSYDLNPKPELVFICSVSLNPELSPELVFIFSV